MHTWLMKSDHPIMGLNTSRDFTNVTQVQQPPAPAVKAPTESTIDLCLTDLSAVEVPQLELQFQVDLVETPPAPPPKETLTRALPSLLPRHIVSRHVFNESSE